MTLILAYKDRGLTRDFQIDGASGVITPGTNDKVRVIIGREGKLGTDFADAEFSVTSDAATPAGSSITKGAQNTLRLDATDLQFSAGTYTLFFDFFDNADAGEWKNVERQVFVLEDS